ncbi:hypothetical protein GC722_13040 [Auraticoccus sp. F435]|uniref:Helicase n=1 Tax=Auraticoccus cholistanensis TaxID=2656650 RepID=A0A6A9UW51_9ACTN|nr:hypothetical protein [Auraticoccus cholistanensis]
MSAGVRGGSRPGAGRGERGSGTGLTVAVVAVLALVATAVALVGSAALHTGRARAVADLAALAGARALSEAGEGCAAARRTAELNGARLQDCRVEGDAISFVVSVRVRVELPLRTPGLPRHVQADAHAGTADLAAARP